jgi:hypothetical protein
MCAFTPVSENEESPVPLSEYLFWASDWRHSGSERPIAQIIESPTTTPFQELEKIPYSCRQMLNWCRVFTGPLGPIRDPIRNG